MINDHAMQPWRRYVGLERGSIRDDAMAALAYGARVIGNQLVIAVSCPDATPPCTGPGFMIFAVAAY